METLTADEGKSAFLSASDGLPLPRVLIVDDHPFFSLGLASILKQERLAHHVDTVASVPSAATELQSHQDTALVLLDLTLQGEAGLSLFNMLEDIGLPIPVVVISSREDETSVRAAKAAGAIGFMPKSSGRATLVKMIRSVATGAMFYPSLQLPPQSPEHLTPRQLEVLGLLADGLPNKRICQALDLTEHTVKTHLKAIFAHLGVHNRTACVVQARTLGLI